jgi:hypothetical protein
MEFRPCYDRGEILKMSGGIESMTLLGIARLDSVSVDDRLWVLFWLLPEKTMRLLACDFAEHTLYIFEKQYPEDKRPRQSIETSRRYAEGEATQEELDAAWASARASAWESAMESARESAMESAWGAARASAWESAMVSAWGAERQWQINRVIEVLEGETDAH